MAETGDIVGPIIGLGVGLIALDMIGHAVHHHHDEEQPRRRKAQSKQAPQRRRDDDWFPDVF